MEIISLKPYIDEMIKFIIFRMFRISLIFCIVVLLNSTGKRRTANLGKRNVFYRFYIKFEYNTENGKQLKDKIKIYNSINLKQIIFLVLKT